MTTSEVRQSRSAVVRVIASSLCFDSEPPVVKQLGKAREAADQIYAALVLAGIVPADPEHPVIGAARVNGADPDVPLFPVSVAAGDDPEA